MLGLICCQYAPLLFAQAGLSSNTASFLASGVSAILMLSISVPAFLFADKWGRRTSAISGGIGLSACMFLIGSLYAAGAVHPYGMARWVVIVSVFLFGLVYCATWGIVGKIYASEIQPTHVRAAANCVAQGLGFVRHSSFLPALYAIVLKASADKSKVYELASGYSHPNTSREVCIWRIFLIWRARLVHSCGPWCLHARDSRALTRRHPRSFPPSSAE